MQIGECVIYVLMQYAVSKQNILVFEWVDGLILFFWVL